MYMRAMLILLISTLFITTISAEEITIESKIIKEFYNQIISDKNQNQQYQNFALQTQEKSFEIKNGTNLKELIKQIYQKENRNCVVRGENYVFDISGFIYVETIEDVKKALKDLKIPININIISVYGYDRVYVEKVDEKK